MSPLNGATEQFLGGIDRIESRLTDLQLQISSGTRVGRPSDDPWAVSSILADQRRIAFNTQVQANLDQVKTELQSGDSALQQSIALIEQAITIASQGASTLAAPARNTLLEQAQSIQQELVTISGTAVNGRYIFSGDLDQQPLYALDPTQPEGVRQLAAATSTRVVTDAGGSVIWSARTAQEIFDARNPDSTPASGNVFDAVNKLIVALQNGDTTAATGAADSLKAASDHLNQQLGLYGIAETRAADASDAAAQASLTEKQELSEARDADVAGDAIQLSQANVELQAALSARSTTSKLTLFDFLS